MVSSRLPGVHQLDMTARRALLAQHVRSITPQQLAELCESGGLGAVVSGRMVENAVGVFGMPLGVCANLRVNAVDRLVLMAVEEPSVIAAASHAALLLRVGAHGEGIEVAVDPAHVEGQVQLVAVAEPERAERAIMAAQSALLEHANAGHDALRAAGGGAIGVHVRHLPPGADPCGHFVVVHLVVDVRDAMGANVVNTMCERIAPRLEALSGGEARMKIVSNLTDRRLCRVHARVSHATLGRGEAGNGQLLAGRIEEASVFAERDPYRAATHNKGIMNGVDAVLLAAGQDWRAVEAGAHAYAARTGTYGALATWRADGDGLVGSMELPMAVGTVGGSARSHPLARVALELAGVSRAADLAAMVAAVGLAQNLGALRALVSEGIQRGHMRLHARKQVDEDA